MSNAGFWLQFMIWCIYCGLGSWSFDQPLRFLVFTEALLKFGLNNYLCGVTDHGLSLFTTYLLGRFRVDTTKWGLVQGFMILLWTICDLWSIFNYYVFYCLIILQGAIVTTIVICILVLVLNLQEGGRSDWIPRVVILIVWAIVWLLLSILSWTPFKDVESTEIRLWLMMYGAILPHKFSHARPPRPLGPYFSPWLRRRRNTVV